MINLKKTLKFRLKTRHNPQYEKWWDLYKRKLGQHKHHWLESSIGEKRVNGFLIVNINPQDHQTIHYEREPTDDEVVEWLIETLEDLFDYIERLQDR